MAWHHCTYLKTADMDSNNGEGATDAVYIACNKEYPDDRAPDRYLTGPMSRRYTMRLSESGNFLEPPPPFTHFGGPLTKNRSPQPQVTQRKSLAASGTNSRTPSFEEGSVDGAGGNRSEMEGEPDVPHEFYLNDAIKASAESLVEKVLRAEGLENFIDARAVELAIAEATQLSREELDGAAQDILKDMFVEYKREQHVRRSISRSTNMTESQYSADEKFISLDAQEQTADLDWYLTRYLERRARNTEPTNNAVSMDRSVTSQRSARRDSKRSSIYRLFGWRDGDSSSPQSNHSSAKQKRQAESSENGYFEERYIPLSYDPEEAERVHAAGRPKRPSRQLPTIPGLNAK